ncbi:hypothetical protein LCGC14_0475300 [marine sediment metagenome]|uniref:Uncharacterized protein n=1 Tax=marine sediment metagenome TaxID=412755 RepID=A0A0F9STU4_9ZZZZ
MKVTINKKPVKVEEKVIDWKTLQGGTVVKFCDKSVGLVYDKSAKFEKGMVIISGIDRPTIADGYRSMEITKVLGKLTGIIVDEI